MIARLWHVVFLCVFSRHLRRAPLIERVERGQERRAGVGERVFDLRRNGIVYGARHQSVRFEFAQRFRQHHIRDARDAAFEFVVAGVFLRVQIPEDRQLLFLPNDVERVEHGTPMLSNILECLVDWIIDRICLCH